MPKPIPPRTRRARELRAASTDVEHKLWSVLRNRQLAGAKFRRQLPVDRYFADFACVEARLIVELDGSQHMEVQAAYDIERTRTLEAGGWFVMRFWNNDVIDNLEGVVEAILAQLELASG